MFSNSPKPEITKSALSNVAVTKNNHAIHFIPEAKLLVFSTLFESHFYFSPNHIFAWFHQNLNFSSAQIHPHSYFTPTQLFRFHLVVQLQHAMSIMKSQMHGVNMMHTILVNQSNSVMFSKSKFQQNIGLEKDSQLWFVGEIFKVHLFNSGMPIFSIFTERTVESMFWSILDHMIRTGIDLGFMNSSLLLMD